MSLYTDRLFTICLSTNEDVYHAVEGRIYNTVDDEIEPESAKVPCIVVMNRGTSNDEGSKDDNYESDYDIDDIEIEVSAITRNELASIAKMVRNAIRNGIDDVEDDDIGLVYYRLTASPVQFDMTKPCYFQSLRYQCETLNK